MKETTPELSDAKKINAAENNDSEFAIEAPLFNPTAQLKADPVQMQEHEEEEELMLKKGPFQLQEMEEEEELLQGKQDPNPSHGGSEQSTKTSLPETVQAQMESTMGADFSGVSVHKDSEKASSMGALAYAQGNDVHFAPGKYDPGSQSGQELIGHELAHVVQQREGRVSPTTQMKGQNVNDDPSLEREADQMGAKAAKKKK